MRALAAAWLLTALSAAAAPVTYAHDPARTGWYPDQQGLAPDLISGGSFGQLWKTTVNGQVYAQPLVFNGIVLVATESNWIYGLDEISGAVLWSRSLGVPFNPNNVIPGWLCPDIAPTIGVTGTPVIDDATGTAFLVSKTYAAGNANPAALRMHAVDLTTGVERLNFPVDIQGSAQNDPGHAFAPTMQHQRPALLLLNGVVYAGFGGHCDFQPYQGWIAGVSTTGVLRALWTDRIGALNSGAGIWQAGTGLVSDRPGSIVVTTGNAFGGGSPTGSIPGSAVPSNLGNSVVRLSVKVDGTLAPADFFAPSNAAVLDNVDGDLGSSGPVALPPAFFGTAALPHLIAQGGKEGYVYLLNADALGGVGQGTGAPPDAVVARLGPGLPVFGHAGVWPGDGGWLYFSGSGGFAMFRYGVTGGGAPTLNLAAETYGFSFTSGSPIVTSNGTQAGSALVWTNWMADASGANAQLRAYDAVPLAGNPNLRFAAPIGTAAKFSAPGVADGRLFVGTKDASVIAFGSPVATILSGSALSFPATPTGATSTLTETITAGGSLTITAVTSSSAQFSVGPATPPLPAQLTAGQTLTVPVTFAPVAAANLAATLTATSTAGSLKEGMSGVGLFNGARLNAVPGAVDFGSIALQTQQTVTLSLTNTGSGDLTIGAVAAILLPFTATGLPAPGAIIPAGKSAVATLAFAPTALGTFASDLIVQSGGGNVTVHLTGTGAPPGTLSIAPLTLDFGTIDIGTTKTLSFTLANTGGTALTITKSKPTSAAGFLRLADVFEGTSIAAGASITVPIEFAPTAAGVAAGGWVLNNDALGGLQTLVFTGTGRYVGYHAVPDPVVGGWQLNGSALVLGGTLGSPLRLTPTGPNLTGTAFWPVPLASANLDISFIAALGGGAGGDGLALVLADPAAASATSIGAAGDGLGFAGIAGTAVALVTSQGAGEPSGNFAGILTGAGTTADVRWLATTTAVPPLREAPHLIHVQSADGALVVAIDGVQVLSQRVALSAQVLVGFAAASGVADDRHDISDVSIRSGTRLPAPTISLSPADRTAVAGLVAVAVTAAPAASAALAAIELHIDGAVVAQRAASPLTFSWDTSAVPNGAHLLEAFAMDADGLGSPASATVAVFNAPRVSISAPGRPSGVATLSAAAIAPAGTTLSSLSLSLDGAQVASGSAVASFAWDTSALQNGTSHTVAATALDKDGSSATSSAAVLIANPPQIAITAPAAGAVVSGDVPVTAAAVAAPGTSIASTRILADGAVIAATPSGAWASRAVANGPHVLTADTLAADGTAAASAPVAVTVRNPPSVSIAAPAGDVIGAVTVAVFAEPPVGTQLSSLSLSIDGVPVASGSASPLAFSWQTASVANGSHLMTATATDADGAAAVSAPVAVAVRNDFALTVGPAIRVLTAGGVPQTYAVVATFTGAPMPVALSANGLPQGVTAAFDPPALGASGTSTLTLTASAAAPAGPAPVTVAGVAGADGDSLHSVTVLVTIAEPPAVNLDDLGFDRIAGLVTFEVAATAGAGLASLQLFDGPHLIASGAQSPLRVVWDTRAAVNGLHTLVAVAIDGGGTTTTSSASVQVLNDFAFTSPALAVALNAGGDPVTVSLDTAVVGAAEPITLSAARLPAGITATFRPNPVLGGRSATVTLAAQDGTAAEAATIELHATTFSLGGGDHVRTLALAVAAAAPATPSAGKKGCASASGDFIALFGLLALFRLRRNHAPVMIRY